MNKSELREKFGYAETDFIIIYIAEFIPRKRHEFLLRALPCLRGRIPELKVILPGRGVLLKEMKKLAVDLEIDDITRFPGYRRDIDDLCRISDVHVAVSRQEGLSINNIEAMACGLPLVASDIRGHRDVIADGRNGFLFPPDDPGTMVEKIVLLHGDRDLRGRIARNNAADAERFSVDIAVRKMAAVYEGAGGSRS